MMVVFGFYFANRMNGGFSKQDWWIGIDGVSLLAFRVVQIGPNVQRQSEEESELRQRGQLCTCRDQKYPDGTETFTPRY
jgi:hypothetical protein